ncbi:hypothetical protein ACUJ46_00325 [Sandaracinobacteroides sp. A072]|uniref:hypothetical protein n=1 Tax=Sandaracinobacteroides sp. A072 TaxID=3461146 RepID=UPI0040419C85
MRMMGASSASAGSQALLALAGLLLLLRALLPAGWMPALSPDGMTLVVCSAAGLQALPDGEGPFGNPAGTPDESAHPPCAFAGLGGPSILPRLPLWLPHAIPVLATWAGVEAPVRALVARGWLTPPSQAPPARG